MVHDDILLLLGRLGEEGRWNVEIPGGNLVVTEQHRLQQHKGNVRPLLKLSVTPLYSTRGRDRTASDHYGPTRLRYDRSADIST